MSQWPWQKTVRKNVKHLYLFHFNYIPIQQQYKNEIECTLVNRYALSFLSFAAVTHPGGHMWGQVSGRSPLLHHQHVRHFYKPAQWVHNLRVCLTSRLLENVLSCLEKADHAKCAPCAFTRACTRRVVPLTVIMWQKAPPPSIFNLLYPLMLRQTFTTSSRQLTRANAPEVWAGILTARLGIFHRLPGDSRPVGEQPEPASSRPQTEHLCSAHAGKGTQWDMSLWFSS